MDSIFHNMIIIVNVFGSTIWLLNTQIDNRLLIIADVSHLLDIYAVNHS